MPVRKRQGTTTPTLSDCGIVRMLRATCSFPQTKGVFSQKHLLIDLGLYKLWAAFSTDAASEVLSWHTDGQILVPHTFLVAHGNAHGVRAHMEFTAMMQKEQGERERDMTTLTPYNFVK